MHSMCPGTVFQQFIYFSADPPASIFRNDDHGAKQADIAMNLKATCANHLFVLLHDNEVVYVPATVIEWQATIL